MNTDDLRKRITELPKYVLDVGALVWDANEGECQALYRMFPRVTEITREWMDECRRSWGIESRHEVPQGEDLPEGVEKHRILEPADIDLKDKSVTQDDVMDAFVGCAERAAAREKELVGDGGEMWILFDVIYEISNKFHEGEPLYGFTLCEMVGFRTS